MSICYNYLLFIFISIVSQVSKFIIFLQLRLRDILLIKQYLLLFSFNLSKNASESLNIYFVSKILGTFQFGHLLWNFKNKFLEKKNQEYS